MERTMKFLDALWNETPTGDGEAMDETVWHSMSAPDVASIAQACMSRLLDFQNLTKSYSKSDVSYKR